MQNDLIQVRFLPSKKVEYCHPGENLLEVARRAGIYIEAPCNGSVSCGKCKVRLLSGSVRAVDERLLNHFKFEDGYISACHSELIEDIEVAVPEVFAASVEEMRIDIHSVQKDLELFNTAKGYITDNGMRFTSYVKKEYIEIKKPDLADNISDWDRIRRHLKMHYGFTSVFCRLPVLKRIPQFLRSSDFSFTITHIPRGPHRTTIINLEQGDTTSRLFGVCVDIGTTSVASFLVDMYQGELLAKASTGNAQIAYGNDVINRIIYAAKDDGLEILNRLLIDETINPLLQKMCYDSGVDKDEIVAFVAAGNTTMSHLFLGIYPDYLRREPYVPGFLRAPFVKASELEIDINPETFLYVVPSVSSYVGGDIAAGILASGIWASEEEVLLIDLGTNGELVFGNREYLLTCACSAGPAFEGGGISCGMRAAYGAIEKLSLDAETLVPVLTVIGGGKPQGICGSGIIDLIAEMRTHQVVNLKGKINLEHGSNRIRFDHHGTPEFVVAFKEEYDLAEDITITEVDIDSFIRTKGAVYSGAATLLSSIGKDFNTLEKIYIAGGIGNSLDIEKSIQIGLLPDIARNKFSYIGNSSLMGCYLTLMSEDGRRTLERAAEMMTYIELSVYPEYMDRFISACFLPHTDLELFPSVASI